MLGTWASQSQPKRLHISPMGSVGMQKRKTRGSKALCCQTHARCEAAAQPPAAQQQCCSQGGACLPATACSAGWHDVGLAVARHAACHAGTAQRSAACDHARTLYLDTSSGTTTSLAACSGQA